jgi:alpha-tubulin suppressor-like RCC1 family protein
LGDGTTTTTRNTPVAVSGGHVFDSIYRGQSVTCGLTNAGAAYCWGRNSEGQLGDGTTSNSSIPVAVSGGHVFQQLVLAYKSTCGLTTGNETYCWGANNYGQLGDGGTTDSSVPAAISSDPNFTSLVPTELNAAMCGRVADGTPYCWGQNIEGQLGNGSTANILVPTALSKKFSKIGSNSSSMCGILE